MFGICKYVLFMPQLMTGGLKIGPCCSSISAEGGKRERGKKKEVSQRKVLYRGLDAGSLPID